jgi:hypothetical protein
MVGITECKWRMPEAIQFLFQVCRKSDTKMNVYKVDGHVDALMQRCVVLVKRNISNNK